MKNELKQLLIASLLILFLTSCNDEANLINPQEDFFCHENKPEMFLRLDLEGGDVSSISRTSFDIDLCMLTNEISSDSLHWANIDNELYTRSFTTIISAEEYVFILSMNGTFYQEELDLSIDRDYANKVLNDDFQFRVGTLTGIELWTTESGLLNIPVDRPSFVTFEIGIPNETLQTLYYTSEDQTSLENFPEFCEDFQQGSYFQVTGIEEIDYQNPDFPNVRYNYILSGEFKCRIYRFGTNNKERYIDVKSGSFRLPVYVPETSGVFETP